MMFQPFGQYSDWILVLLALPLSGLLLRHEGRSLDALGFDQPRRRLRELAIGFATTSSALALTFVLSAAVAGLTWQWNQDSDIEIFLQDFTLPLVAKALIVGLLFQGYLLFQLLRRVGPTAGLWIAAAAFGIYDCFALHTFDDLVKTAAVFASSSFYGFVLALAYRQTGSLAAPIGLNLGWHFTQKSVFGDLAPTYELLVLPQGQTLPRSTAGGVIWVIVIAGALLAYSWALSRRRAPVLGDPNVGRSIQS